MAEVGLLYGVINFIQQNSTLMTLLPFPLKGPACKYHHSGEVGRFYPIDLGGSGETQTFGLQQEETEAQRGHPTSQQQNQH